MGDVITTYTYTDTGVAAKKKPMTLKDKKISLKAAAERMSRPVIANTVRPSETKTAAFTLILLRRSNVILRRNASRGLERRRLSHRQRYGVAPSCAMIPRAFR